MSPSYPRDLQGYGRQPPFADWPGSARVAVQFVLNFEEGGENSVLHGDAGSEQFLSEMFNPAAFPARHLSMESIYEYGSKRRRVARAARVRAARLPCSRSAWRWSAAPTSPVPSTNWATRSPATAGAGSATRTLTKRPNASAWKRSRA